MNAIVSTSELSALLAAFTRTSTSIISDCLDRLPGALLTPFHRIEGTMAGIALTVKVLAAITVPFIRRWKCSRLGRCWWSTAGATSVAR